MTERNHLLFHDYFDLHLYFNLSRTINRRRDPYLESSSSRNLIFAIRLDRVSVPSDLSPRREVFDIVAYWSKRLSAEQSNDPSVLGGDPRDHCLSSQPRMTLIRLKTFANSCLSKQSTKKNKIKQTLPSVTLLLFSII
jgi:hypothetical protein